MTSDKWIARGLGEVCRQVSQRSKGEELPILSVSKGLGIVLQTEKFKRRIASDDTSNYKRVRFGQFVYDPMLLWAGNIGRQRRVDEGIVSPAYTVFEISEEIDGDYLEYFLKRPEMLEIYKKISRGTNVRRQKALFSDFASLKFPLPPLHQQRRIAAILSAVDDAIERTQAVIDQLQAVKKAMMAELMTHGLPGRHTRFKQTSIGEIPEGWGLLPLGELASVERGKFSHRPRNDPRFFGGRYPFIQTGDVAASDGRIISFSQTLNDAGLAVSRLFPTGTIVITIAANIGDTGIALLPVAFPDSLVGIQVGERVDNRFLELVLRTRKKNLEDLAPQNAQKNINLETLRPLPIQVPSMEEQVRVSNLFEAINGRLIAESETLVARRALKAALMSVLLTGELRVTPDEATP